MKKKMKIKMVRKKIKTLKKNSQRICKRKMKNKESVKLFQTLNMDFIKEDSMSKLIFLK